MEQRKLVSIIVPIYNVEKYLDECIQSLFSQTYKNLEIILVDDGSSDKSPEMCDNYEKQDPRIRVIHKKNAGLGFARNTGLDKATGNYVVFLDSDDYLDSDAIEELVITATNNNAQLVKGGLKKVDNNQNILYLRGIDRRVYEGREIDQYLTPRLLGSSPSKSDSIEMSVCATLFDRELIEENNLRFNSERQVLSEDLPFNLTYLSYCEKAVTLDHITYNYRLNFKSTSQKYQSNKFVKVIQFFEFIDYQYKDLARRENIRLSRLFFLYLKHCIKKELLDTTASTKQIINKIRQICSNKMTVERLNNYPINRLPLKHQIFLKLVKGKHSILLYTLAKADVF